MDSSVSDSFWQFAVFGACEDVPCILLPRVDLETLKAKAAALIVLNQPSLKALTANWIQASLDLHSMVKKV